MSSMQGMTSTAVASDAKKSVLFEAHSAPQPAPADKPAVSEKDDERDRAQKTLDNCKVLLLFSLLTELPGQAVLESLGQSQKRVDDVLARASSVMGASEAFEAKWQAFQRKVDHVLSASLAQMRAEMAASCDRTGARARSSERCERQRSSCSCSLAQKLTCSGISHTLTVKLTRAAARSAEKVDSPAQVKLMAAQPCAVTASPRRDHSVWEVTQVAALMRGAQKTVFVTGAGLTPQPEFNGQASGVRRQGSRGQRFRGARVCGG
eukprot:1131184-Rhodomonas_salina.2